MKLNETTFTQIEAYINETMSEADRAAFEKEMSNNPELAEEVEINRQMLLNYSDDSWSPARRNSVNTDRAMEAYLRSDEAEALSEAIRNAEGHYKSQKAGIRRKTFFYYAAAVIVVALLAGNFFINSGSGDLYTNYKDWENIPSLTVRGDNNALIQGAQRFKQQNYSEAIAVFSNYFKENPATLNPQALMYLGASYTEAGQYEDAINTFDRLLNSNALDSDMAYWYKALTYLKQEDKEAAKSQLEYIVSDAQHPYFDKAQKLMGKLK